MNKLTKDQALVVAQRDIEYMHSKEKIHNEIMADIQNSPELLAMVDNAIPILMKYMMQDCLYSTKEGETRFWASKSKRLAHLMSIDLEEIVTYIVCIVLPLGKPTTLSNVAGQLAGALKYHTLKDGLQTAGEILAVVAEVGIYELVPPMNTNKGMWELHPKFVSDAGVLKFIEQTMYLPPMICMPNKLTCNTDSGYLTIEKDSLVTGKDKRPYNFKICLDHLNILNRVTLSLDMGILKTIDEINPDDIEDRDKRKQLKRMVNESYGVYKHLYQAGNKFYLTHKYDSRGRTYAQGYHVTSQGSSFKKAILNLHHKELIET